MLMAPDSLVIESMDYCARLLWIMLLNSPPSLLSATVVVGSRGPRSMFSMFNVHWNAAKATYP
jgi:hypothetical protein